MQSLLRDDLLLRALLLLLLHAGRYLQPQRVQADKAGGIVLVVCLRRVRLHRRDIGIVQADRALHAGADHVALIQLQAHGAGDVLLALA